MEYAAYILGRTRGRTDSGARVRETPTQRARAPSERGEPIAERVRCDHRVRHARGHAPPPAERRRPRAHQPQWRCGRTNYVRRNGPGVAWRSAIQRALISLPPPDPPRRATPRTCGARVTPASLRMRTTPTTCDDGSTTPIRPQLSPYPIILSPFTALPARLATQKAFLKQGRARPEPAGPAGRPPTTQSCPTARDAHPRSHAHERAHTHTPTHTHAPGIHTHTHEVALVRYQPRSLTAHRAPGAPWPRPPPQPRQAQQPAPGDKGPRAAARPGRAKGWTRQRAWRAGRAEGRPSRRCCRPAWPSAWPGRGSSGIRQP